MRTRTLAGWMRFSLPGCLIIFGGTASSLPASDRIARRGTPGEPPKSSDARPTNGFPLFADDLQLRAVAENLTTAFTVTSQLSFRVESGGSSNIEVTPGQSILYRVVGELSDDNSLGLALVGFDLDFDGGNLAQADNPTGDPESGCENPMIHFTLPWGITNPAGFGGTIINGDLIQVGGAQNTVNNTKDNAPFPIGSVLLGVAAPSGCGPTVLVTGSLTAPLLPGHYRLALENPFANIIKLGETGIPFWATQAAAIGTVTHLSIVVMDTSGAGGACCLSTGVCRNLTASDCLSLGGDHHGDATSCDDDFDADGHADDCDACIRSNMSPTVDMGDCDSAVENLLFSDGCTMLDAIDQCISRPTQPLRFARCVNNIATQWQVEALISNEERQAIVDCVRSKYK